MFGIENKRKVEMLIQTNTQLIQENNALKAKKEKLSHNLIESYSRIIRHYRNK